MQQIASNFPETNLTGDERATVFYNMVGNFIPPEWRHLRNGSGKALSKTSRQLLSLIVWSLQSSRSKEASDAVATELQESYYFFEQQLGVGQRRVRQCLIELQQAGFIALELVTVIKHHIKCHNTPSIKLLKEFKNRRSARRTANNNVDSSKNFPDCLQDFSPEPERNFSNAGNNFQPHYIIDNNLSILKSRYRCKGDFVDNFVDKSDDNKNDNDENSNPPPANSSESWLAKAANKAKDWCGFKKKLAEFHPLTADDAATLQFESGREFNLNFINMLLLKLSDQYPEHLFPHKKAVLNYMTKALTHELRQACQVNNEGFRFKQEAEVKQREEYLEQVEYSRDASRTSQLKRKIAARFEPQLAYQLLTSCRFAEPEGNRYDLQLVKDINVSEFAYEHLLQEIRAVYGNKITELDIIPLPPDQPSSDAFTSKSTATKPGNSYAHLSELDSNSVWFKIRQCLVKILGADVDKAWFSKLEVVEEDRVNKKITLKAQSSFISDWVQQKYRHALEQAFGLQNFSFEMAGY